MELWKPIPEFENCGEVSNLGRIRSSYGKIRKTVIANNGYIRVGLKKIGAKNTNYVTVHRLVAKAFCEGFEEGLTVNHIDGDKLNNSSDNLEWITQKNNIIHASKIGLRPSNHRKPKIPHEDINIILDLVKNGHTQYEIANKYGVCQTAIFKYIKKHSGRLSSAP
jgi:hypothetical protein